MADVEQNGVSIAIRVANLEGEFRDFLKEFDANNLIGLSEKLGDIDLVLAGHTGQLAEIKSCIDMLIGSLVPPPVVKPKRTRAKSKNKGRK